MVGWALTFLVIAIIAGVFGFGGIAVASAGIAKIIFYVFLVLLLVCAVTRRRFPVGANPTRRTRSSRKQSEQSWR